MPQVFISYKTGSVNNPTAELLYEFLQSQDYQVFLDRIDLHGGYRWDENIFEQISQSDVVIVLITGDVIVSNTDVGPLAAPWVQREVDFARGCHVRILPVVVYNDDLQKDPATRRDRASLILDVLALTGFQYVRALDVVSRPDQRFGHLLEEIKRLAAETRNEQKHYQRSLAERWEEQDKSDPLKNPPESDMPRYRTFLVIDPDSMIPHPSKVHLSAGNITAMSTARQPIDVLVNSENVYMQMQRVVDRDSVSKTIRLSGRKGWGNYIEEDTIQQELFLQVFPPNRNGVPVQIGDVFVTSSGHAQSDLRKKGIKRIFHVAAVDADPQAGQKQINDKGRIILCIKNCLEALQTLNEDNQKSNLPLLTSIIFPLIGTGQGGLDVKRAAEAIVDTVKEYLLENQHTPLTDVYITAYTMNNVADVEQIMGLKLQKTTR